MDAAPTATVGSRRHYPSPRVAPTWNVPLQECPERVATRMETGILTSRDQESGEPPGGTVVITESGVLCACYMPQPAAEELEEQTE